MRRLQAGSIECRWYRGCPCRAIRPPDHSDSKMVLVSYHAQRKLLMSANFIVSAPVESSHSIPATHLPGGGPFLSS
jgi:uncharacterized protein YodC (DUF2158 family)